MLHISAIWSRTPPELASVTGNVIDAACGQLSLHQPGFIFFRADDIAAPGKSFARLVELFSRQRAPLCLAVVPAWLTAARWQYLRKTTKNGAALWCWHQHGWRHKNHQKIGKKQEFGPDRTQPDLENDMVRGRHRLESIMGEKFFPVFTPPWNRCDARSLQLVQTHGYVAVSRSQGSSASTPPGLADYVVNVDLHTRKDRNPAEDWTLFFEELKAAISTGYCGMMIHHQRMNDVAFEFMEMLLKTIVARKKLQLVHFENLVESRIPWRSL